MRRAIMGLAALAIGAPVAAAQAPPVPEPQVRIASDRAIVRDDRAAVILRCSGGEAIAGFSVTVTLRARIGGRSTLVGTRRGGFCASRGRSTIRVPLNATGRRTLRLRGGAMTTVARAKLRSGDVASRRVVVEVP